MHPSSAGHLTAEQFLQAASGRLDDPNQQAHLEVCPDCNRGVEEWRAWLESGLAKLARSGEEAIPRATDECLTDGEMVGLLFGPNSEETWSNLAHASGCRRCGRLLRSAMDRQEADREEKEFIAALDSHLRNGSIGWPTDTRFRLLRPRGPLARKLCGSLWRRG